MKSKLSKKLAGKLAQKDEPSKEENEVSNNWKSMIISCGSNAFSQNLFEGIFTSINSYLFTIINIHSSRYNESCFKTKYISD